MTDINKKNSVNEDKLHKIKTDNVAEKVMDLSDDELDMAAGGSCGITAFKDANKPTLIGNRGMDPEELLKQLYIH